MTDTIARAFPLQLEQADTKLLLTHPELLDFVSSAWKGLKMDSKPAVLSMGDHDKLDGSYDFPVDEVDLDAVTEDECSAVTPVKVDVRGHVASIFFTSGKLQLCRTYL